MGSMNKLLALVFLLLVGYASYYWVQQHNAGKEGAAVFKPSPDPVQTLSIKVNGRPAIELSKLNGRWRMTAPFDDFADEGAVENLLTYAKGMKKERVISPSVHNLEPFGLSLARDVLLIGAGSDSQELLLGHNTVDERSIFAAKGGSSEVFALPNEVREKLFVKPFQLRERRFLLLPAKEIEKMTIASGDREIVLSKSDSTWRQTKGAPWKEAADNAAKIIQDLSRAVIFDFVHEPESKQADQGLSPPRVSITVAGPGGEQKLLLGAEGPRGFVFAKVVGRPGVVLVDKPDIWTMCANL